MRAGPGHPPIHADIRVVERDCPVAFGRIGGRAFIDDLGLWHARHEPMREPDRHQKLSTVLKAELGAHPLAEGRAAFADVDRHIEKRAAPAPNQLGLRMRRRLKMQAAYRARPPRERMIVLHKVDFDPVRGQCCTVPAFAEKAARIAVPRGCENKHAVKRRSFDLHRVAVSPSPLLYTRLSNSARVCHNLAANSLRRLNSRQNSTPSCALTPSLNGCLSSDISVTRSAASINSGLALRPVRQTWVMSGFWVSRKSTTSSISR